MSPLQHVACIRLTRSRRSGVLIAPLFLLAAQPALANHPEGPECQDDHDFGSESMAATLFEYYTNQPIAEGTPLLVGTRIKVAGLATASGSCTVKIQDGYGGCMLAELPENPEQRDVYNILHSYTVTNSYYPNGWTFGLSPTYAIIPGTSTITGYHVVDAMDTTNTTGPVSLYLSWVGTNRFNFQSSIHWTTCQLAPSSKADSLTVEVMAEEQRCDADDRPQDFASRFFGNPCDAASGNKRQTETDYTSPATGLKLVRTYNSIVVPNRGLGHGWIAGAHRRLERVGATIRAVRANGSMEPFTASGSAWTALPDATLALTQDASGYILTLAGGASERYDLAGKLLSETSAIGQVANYAYSNGRLQSMTGPFGHSLNFTYNAEGNLATVTDPAGRVIQYGYDADENLTSVTYPDGTVRSYHYEHTGYPLHALTGITDENGTRFASFGYSATNGKASFTEYATTTNGSPQ